MTSGTMPPEPVNIEAAARIRFLVWQKGDPNQVGHQTFMRWIVLCCARHRRLSLGQPAGPKTVVAA